MKIDLNKCNEEELWVYVATHLKKNGRHYVNSECKHIFVEFPGTAPVGIGEDNEINPVTKKYNGVEIKRLSPTDCVKDRLASYIHFKSRDGPDQAVLVAKNHPINFTEVKRWCTNEGSLKTYEEFFEQLKQEGNK